MKQTPDLDKAQHNMRPGAITRNGFLGDDRRNVIEILIDDEARVRRLGVSHAGIAARMRALRAAGMSGLGEGARVPPHYEVRVESVRGRLPCPFGHKGLYPKTNVTVRNLALQREVIFTDLSIHMIEAHGFYEGRHGDFRVDPEELVAVLNVAPLPAE